MSIIKPLLWGPINATRVGPRFRELFAELKLFQPLWEGAGGPFDVIGNADGTLGSPAPVWTQGEEGCALYFDGVDDYYQVAANRLVFPDGPWTFVARVYTPDVSGSGWPYMFSSTLSAAVGS